MLIIVCGLPGSGKTTVAKFLSKFYGAPHLNTDVIRKKLIARPQYSEEEKMRVYAEILSETRKLLTTNRNVIMDGTFYKRELRNSVLGLAKRFGVDSCMILCKLPEAEVKKRLEERKKAGRSISDADFGVHLKMKAEFEPIEKSEGRLIEIDMSNNWTENVNEIKKFIGS